MEASEQGYDRERQRDPDHLVPGVIVSLEQWTHLCCHDAVEH